jgi:integration host factor subunit alpha
MGELLGLGILESVRLSLGLVPLTWRNQMAGTKDSIVEVVSGETGFPKSRSLEIVGTLIELIKKTLESGDDVLVGGFGKFKAREKNARRERDPATGEDMMLEPKRVVTFHCSGKLRKKINK